MASVIVAQQFPWKEEAVGFDPAKVFYVTARVFHRGENGRGTWFVPDYRAEYALSLPLGSELRQRPRPIRAIDPSSYRY